MKTAQQTRQQHVFLDEHRTLLALACFVTFAGLATAFRGCADDAKMAASSTAQRELTKAGITRPAASKSSVDFRNPAITPPGN